MTPRNVTVVLTPDQAEEMDALIGAYAGLLIMPAAPPSETTLAIVARIADMRERIAKGQADAMTREAWCEGSHQPPANAPRPSYMEMTNYWWCRVCDANAKRNGNGLLRAHRPWVRPWP